jgi:hypothetical protein
MEWIRAAQCGAGQMRCCRSIDVAVNDEGEDEDEDESEVDDTPVAAIVAGTTTTTIADDAVTTERKMRETLDACAKCVTTKLALENALSRGWIALARSRAMDGVGAALVVASASVRRAGEAQGGRRRGALASASVREARSAFEEAVSAVYDAVDAQRALQRVVDG